MSLIGVLLKQPRRIRKVFRSGYTVYEVERQTWFFHRWKIDAIFDLDQNIYRPAVFDSYKEAYAYTLPFGGPYQPLFTQ